MIQVGSYDAYSSYYTGVIVVTDSETQVDYADAIRIMEEQVCLVCFQR
jgi:hypothetical protein